MQRSRDGGGTWERVGSVPGEPYKFKALGPEELTVHDEYVGPGYAVPTPGSNEAIRLFAQTEGLILDPVYTAKAAAAALARSREQREFGSAT